MHSSNHDSHEFKKQKKLSYKLADKNTKCLHYLAVIKQLRCLLQMYPDSEKIRSDGTLVAKMHKYFLRLPMQGNNLPASSTI